MSTLFRRYSTLAVLGFALVGCRRHSSVIDSIRHQLLNGATQVDIGQSGDFAWDEMFVFGPYYPKDEICRTLKLSASQCSTTGIKDVDEGEFLLVFMQHDTVSETESFPRKIADFDESERCQAKRIRRDAAVFTVEHKTGGVYLVCRL
jgi:hypothetical protein